MLPTEQTYQDPTLLAHKALPEASRRSYFVTGRLCQLIFYEDEVPVERAAATTYPIEPTDRPAT